MRQSPEIELVSLCARPRLDDTGVRRMLALLQGPLDWPGIFELAEYYRTIPLLALHLRHHAAERLSDDILERLQAHHRDSTRHNLVLASEVLRLMDFLSGEGVDAVPFKGPVSAVLAWGDMAMRACGDIDILVRKSHHARAERLLQSQGYHVASRYQTAMQSALWHRQRGISVDLHWGIPPQVLPLDADRLWENLEPVELLGRAVLTFSRRDTLLVTAVNAVKEYWKPSLHHLSDIAALTAQYDDADWRHAFRRARQLRCQRMLAAALLLVHRLLDVDLPAAGPTRLFSRRGINSVVDELQDHLFPAAGDESIEAAMKPLHMRDRQNYYLALTDSPWRRSRDWLKWLVTPNTADRALLKLPGALSFLYYLVRPLRLLFKRL